MANCQYFFILFLAMFWFINLQDLQPDISGYTFLQVLASLDADSRIHRVLARSCSLKTRMHFSRHALLASSGYYVFVGSMSFTGVFADQVGCIIGWQFHRLHSRPKAVYGGKLGKP